MANAKVQYERGKNIEETKEEFLRLLADDASVCEVCRKLGLPRQTAYQWRDVDPDFAKEWDRAAEFGTDALEDEVTRRANKGWREPVYWKGQIVGHVRKYSDTLLMFMLKSRRPAKFRDNAINVNNTNNVIAGNTVVSGAIRTAEEFDALPLEDRIRILQEEVGAEPGNQIQGTAPARIGSLPG